MSTTKFVLTETASYASKLLHHEEIENSSQEILPNFTNPLASNIGEGNDTFTFKEATSQPGRLDFMEATSKEIGKHEIDKHCNLFIRR